MGELKRVRVGINGIQGSPGVATFYFLDLATGLASLQSLFYTIRTKFPAGTTFQVESSGDVIDETNGKITGGWQGAAQDLITSNGVGPYAGASGGQIKWATQTIVDGHRLKGRTFCVPLSTECYVPGGGLNPQTAGDIATAAGNFVFSQSSSFVIWHRPKFGPKPPGGAPAPVLRPGSHGLVTGGSVPTKTVVLRSRRD